MVLDQFEFDEADYYRSFGDHDHLKNSEAGELIFNLKDIVEDKTFAMEAGFYVQTVGKDTIFADVFDLDKPRERVMMLRRLDKSYVALCSRLVALRRMIGSAIGVFEGYLGQDRRAINAHDIEYLETEFGGVQQFYDMINKTLH